MEKKRLGDIRLTLFFTAGLSMQTWADLGMLDREMELYDRMSRYLREVNIVTYGEKGDRHFRKDYGGINILPSRWLHDPKKTSTRLLMRYYSHLRRSDVLKSNQILGSDIPIFLKKKLGKKLIIRCGYLLSFMTRKQTDAKDVITEAARLEESAFQNADVGVVSSAWQRDIVLREYDVDPEKIRVIPNYVVTDIFTPEPEVQKKYDLVFVGRPDEQKNIRNLFEAIRILKGRGRNVSLLMVGSCCDDRDIRDRAHVGDLNLALQGNVPNFRLPDILKQARVFILPSLYEGHPKVLLEAMSCGLPCIGTDVDGIRQEISHGETGFLCDTDPESIARAIEALLSDMLMQTSLGEKARGYILGNYSLERVCDLELEVLKEVSGG